MRAECCTIPPEGKSVSCTDAPHLTHPEMLRVGHCPATYQPFAQGAAIYAACILLTRVRLFGSEKAEENKNKEKALPRKELKALKPKPVCNGERPRPGREREGEERGGSRSKPSLPPSQQQCLCQEPAFLKPWARGPALQAEGSPGAGAGKHRGEPSASRVSCRAVLGCRQREGGQRLGKGLF